jgi:hypothetical protein
VHQLPVLAERYIAKGFTPVGMTEDDVRELIQKPEGSDKRHTVSKMMDSAINEAEGQL